MTGGAGFIGSHLARYLLSKGHKVVILDNLSSGKLENVPVADVDCHFADCQNKQALRNAADGCDYVYHCASTVGVQKVLRDPAACIQNILDSTRAVLKLGIPGMYFSTSEVYGKRGGPWQWETDGNELAEDSECILTSAPRWAYAAAKLTGEWLAMDTERYLSREKWQVVRLFNVIGPNQNPAYGAVFPRFIQQALEDRPLTIYGDGSQVRTFTSVHDVVRILDTLRGKTFNVVNVGSTNTLSICQLAIHIKELTDSKSELEYVAYNKAYPSGFEECPSRIPDLNKLRSIIGEFSFTPLETMIQEVAHGRQTVCK